MKPVRLSEVKEGDILRVFGHPCIPETEGWKEFRKVLSSDGQLYVECGEGKHFLDGDTLANQGDAYNPGDADILVGFMWDELPSGGGKEVAAKTEIHPSPAEFTEEQISTDSILRFFHYAHLPPALQEASKPFCDLARHIITTLPRNAERTVALRKLLEAKDCAVRTLVP